ncbi:MAG TPA: SAM-dependent methyltransferase [Candidatus Aminicenantes bacterium]|nr:SAM-dependent methyltransferase [Candidatus Aminicenantes bacterium]
MSNESRILPSSFRDPSGFLFEREGGLYRQINRIYKDHYDQLLSGGLYRALTEQGLLVSHDEVDISPPDPQPAYKIIKPRFVPFISYPYEWCFTQLKEAALAVLKIQKTAFDFGMSLKDASAFNIQFVDGRPLLVDTLSFEKLQLKPWVAYRQFCQHFLNPLLLMAYKDFELNQLSRIFIDGIPSSLTSRLLPFRTRLRPSLASHVHLHALSQRYFSTKTARVRERKIRPVSLAGLVDSLESLVRRLNLRLKKTEWAHYYQETNYTPEAFEGKKKTVEEFLDIMKPDTVWDLGANTGVFSRLASRRGINTVAFDVDLIAVELNYRECLDKNEKHLLPLVMDLTNPTPAIGWENRERKSLSERGPVDAALALALLHHLAISNNLPFPKIAEFLRRICRWLVIEFVPKTDSQVQRLLATREDIFDHYTQSDFEEQFSRSFLIVKVAPIKGTERTLYLMKNRSCPQT